MDSDIVHKDPYLLSGNAIGANALGSVSQLDNTQYGFSSGRGLSVCHSMRTLHANRSITPFVVDPRAAPVSGRIGETKDSVSLPS